jgi:hypothetical protein
LTLHGFIDPASRTGRSIAQPGSPCEEDPALPGLFALISHSKIASAIFE